MLIVATSKCSPHRPHRLIHFGTAGVSLKVDTEGFPTAWQDEHPFGSGAHWEVGWSEEQLSFFARLIEEYTEDEIEAGLLPEAAKPVFSYGESFAEITDTDLLAHQMQEAIRPDIELALIRDQVESLKRLSDEELERRLAAARQSA